MAVTKRCAICGNEIKYGDKNWAFVNGVYYHISCRNNKLAKQTLRGVMGQESENISGAFGALGRMEGEYGIGLRCPYCGTPHSVKERICTKCGKKLPFVSERFQADSDDEIRKALSEAKESKFTEKTKPTIIYNDDYPTKGYAERVAKSICWHFKKLPLLGGNTNFDMFKASAEHPFTRNKVPAEGTNGVVVLEISFPVGEKRGILTSTIFGTTEKMKKNVLEYIEETYPLYLATSDLYGNTYVLRYVYEKSQVALDEPIIPGKSKGPLEVHDIPTVVHRDYELSSVHVKAPKSRLDQPSIWDRLTGAAKAGKEKIPGLQVKKTSFVAIFPRIVVMIVGLVLFLIELTTMGSGENAANYYTFVIGGIAIGAVSVVVGVFEQRADEEKNEKPPEEKPEKKPEKKEIPEEKPVEHQYTRFNPPPANEAPEEEFKEKEEEVGE